MPVQEYVYRVLRVIRIVDGDTCDVELDIGFRLATAQRVRLWGINTPEMKGETKTAGQAAKDELEKLLTGGWREGLFCRTHKDPDNFGRWLGEFIGCTGPETCNINQLLVARGHAVAYRRE